MNRRICLNIIIGTLLVLIITLFFTSCDKDPIYKEGDYLYENEYLNYYENIDGTTPMEKQVRSEQ